ncbi:MAG: FkbM family methyltransferase [Candidatus Obscuribacterales bacterium]
MLKTIGKQIVHFLDYARDHRILVAHATRKYGIQHTLIGWALVALSVVVFKSSIKEMPAQLNFAIQFAAGAAALACFALFHGKGALSVTEPKSDSELHGSHGHLTVRERKALLLIRGTIAVSGYMALAWAGQAFQVVDNAGLFGLDALFYAAILYVCLGQKLRKLQWAGILIATAGALVVLFVDFEAQKWPTALGAGLGGIYASAAMAAIVLMQGVMIQHDTPLRIAFYQCTIGFAVSVILVLAKAAVLGTWGWIGHVPSIEYLYAVSSGVLYAVALIFFFDAFLWTEAIVITVMGFSLDPFAALFAALVGKGVVFTISEAVSAALITAGGIFSVYDEYRADKSESSRGEKKPKISSPVFRISLHRQLADLREQYEHHLIDQYEYIAHRHEFNKVLFQYSRELAGSDIGQIAIEPANVIFSVKSMNARFISDAAARSAPFEVLNFGQYEADEQSILAQMIDDSSVVLDVGAHIGWHSIGLAKQHPRAKIFAFEPIPETYSILERNIKLNEIVNVTCLPYGFSDTPGEVNFHYFPGGSVLASRENLIGHRNGEVKKCLVSTVDVFSKEHALDRLDLIKCDVEGSELAVVVGGLHTISSFLPVIMLELYEEWCAKFEYAATDVEGRLGKLGYQCYMVNGKFLTGGPHDFSSSTNYNYIFLHAESHRQLIDRFVIE